MKAILIGGLLSFLLSIFGTPFAIRYLRKLRIGQEIRSDGPQQHASKRGTPTMGGIVFIFATLLAYLAIHLFVNNKADRGVTVTGIFLLGLFVGMGLVGFLDDYIKIRKRRSLGLNKRGKIIGQLLVGIIFGILAVQITNEHGMTVASTYVSFIKDIDWLQITKFGTVAFITFITIGTANGVNLTDGLDGLATGSSVMVLLAYALIGWWQFRHPCKPNLSPEVYCYQVRDPLEIALIAAIAAGACFGFLWWNASPAKVFMGDTGALGLGGLIGGLAVATRTELLLIIIGGLFVIIVVTEIMQIISFRLFHRRIFRMVPLHHHFELAGWTEVNIVMRFWIIAGLSVAAGIGVFYSDFLYQL